MARAQTVSTMGEVYVNGQRAAMNVALRAGDRVLTGPESTLTVAIGEDAFRLRPLTSVSFDGTADSKLVTGLRRCRVRCSAHSASMSGAK